MMFAFLVITYLLLGNNTFSLYRIFTFLTCGDLIFTSINILNIFGIR